MRLEKITSQELKRLIALKSNKLSFDEVTEDDLDRITELVLNSKSFNGEDTGITLDMIALFPSLEDIRLIGFEVDKAVMEILAGQQGLKSATFVKCKLNDVDFECLNGRLKRVGFTKCGKLDFKYPEVPYVYVQDSEIDFNNIDFEKVKGIHILNSVVKNGRSLAEFKEIERVVLDGTKIFVDDKLQEDVEVYKGTKYSHKKDVELVDTER